jgi:hypothetical protein
MIEYNALNIVHAGQGEAPMSTDESARLVRRWREDEARLYPVVMVRPDLYERAGRLVRAFADELGAHATEAELTAAFRDAERTLTALVSRTGLPTEDVDLGLVTGAAFCMRHREIVAAEQRRRTFVLIAQARERGDAWVVLHESGSPTAIPFRRLEMRLGDGAALHLFIEPDPGTGRPLHGLQALRLDPVSGDWTAGTPIEEARTFEDPSDWERAADELRRRLGDP